jgi:hypothetical protein
MHTPAPQSPITLCWHDESCRILIMTVVGSWYWDDIRSVLIQIREIEAAHEHLFDLIIDARATTLFQSNIIQYIRSWKSQTMYPSTRRLIVVVGVDHFTRVLWKGIATFPFGRHLAASFFDTMADAIAYCQAYTGTQTNLES